MIKPLLFFIAGCLCSMLVHAQDSLFVWTENRSIQWDDFLGQVNDTSKYDAETFAEVRYKYEFSKNTKPKFEVYAMFNKNTSWRRRSKQTDDLLKHEQLHFDIAELYALKLKEAFESYHYSENFAQEIDAIFNVAKTQYHLMQLKCDEETNHSLNKERQAEWEASVSEELHKSSRYFTASGVEAKK